MFVSKCLTSWANEAFYFLFQKQISEESGDAVYLADTDDEDNDDAPLQSSFSQILNTDVLLSGSTDFFTNVKTNDQNLNSSFSWSNFANNLAFMESITEQHIDHRLFNGDDDDEINQSINK